jgi:secreted trypsin-like serine protease
MKNKLKLNNTNILIATLGLLVGVGTSAIALASPHTPFRTPFIVGGDTVSADDPIAATTVFIFGAESDGNYFCSGSVIDTDIIVTAAHCVADHIKNSMRIVFSRNVTIDDEGNLSIPDSSPEVRTIYGAIANPVYTDSTTGIDQHDIAVIRFKGLLPEGYSIATLLDPSVALTHGEGATLAGYGSTSATTEDGTPDLRKVDIQIDHLLGNTEVVLDQSQGKGACWGDSGGPAFAHQGNQLLLWGLTNRAYPDSAQDCTQEVVYTRITEYSDFITQSVASLRKLK